MRSALILAAAIAFSFSAQADMFDNEQPGGASVQSWSNPQATSLTELGLGQYAWGPVGDNDTYTFSSSAGDVFRVYASAPSTLVYAVNDTVTNIQVAANTWSAPVYGQGSFSWVFNGGQSDLSAFSSTNLNMSPDCDQYYLTAKTITAAVPEPETYAMLMAGLGALGFMSRRRRVTV